MRISEQRERRSNRKFFGIRVLVRRMRRFKLRGLSLMGKKIIIGTRGSQLALWQANWVKSVLEEKNPSLSVELVIIKTKGDKILDVPLAKVGGKGLFVKEIESAILAGRIDIAVHSMKDMPAEIPRGLCIGAIPEREITADVLISGNGITLSELKPGARVGTSSLRRSSQLLSARPDLEILPLRGNLDTRIRKLETEDLDAIVLAAAGVRRLGLEDKISEYIDESVMLPAVGQGALCIEIRKNDSKIESLVEALEHPETRSTVLGERAFLNRLEGSCQVPVAALGKIENDIFSLCGLISDLKGETVLRETESGPPDLSRDIGIKLADRLLARGGKQILDNLQSSYRLSDN